MQFAIGVLTHTPIWVFPLFAYLIWQGISAFRSRTQPIRRLLIVPAVFFIMGVSRIAVRQEGQWPVICWLAGAALFVLLGFLTGPRIVSIDKARGLVTRAGSKIPLIRNVVVFALQYGFAVASAVHAGDRQALTLVSCAVSGATSGYFAGWIVALWRRYVAAEKI